MANWENIFTKQYKYLRSGAYLGEIAPLSEHMNPKICITITSAKKIMIM